MRARGESYLDRTFRAYGEDRFGKEAMDKVSSEWLEKYRCESFKLFDMLIREFGEGDNDILKRIFYGYIELHLEHEDWWQQIPPK